MLVAAIQMNVRYNPPTIVQGKLLRKYCETKSKVLDDK